MAAQPHETVDGFSIIVCTRNRRNDLVRLLDSIARESAGRRAAWDVLVVENASEDATRDDVQALAGAYPLPLACVSEERLGLSHARNRGIAEARGDVLVFLDDDITLGPTWFAALEENFADPTVDGAGGPVTPIFPPNAPHEYVRAVLAERCGSTGIYQHGDERREIVPGDPIGAPRGGNMAVRAKIARDVGGFNVMLGWGVRQIPGEETDFFARCQRAGHRIWYLPGTGVMHHLQPDKVGWEYLRRWHIGYGRASVLMRPRPSWPMRLVKAAGQAATWLRFGGVLLFDRSRSSLRPYRKRWQAQGRMAQLLGR
jgi:glycosyltransferase involved in cell wall biosynthesis